MKNIYIYNYKQAEFLIQEGCKLLNIDLNKRTDKLFFKFVRDENFEKIFDKWKTRRV